MIPWIATFLLESTRVVAGPEFNQVAFSIREQAEAAHGRAVSYEVVLQATDDPEPFAKRTLPRLAEHLAAKRLPPEGVLGLMVWVWYEGRAHLFEGTAFVETLRSIGAPRLPPPQDSEGMSSV